MRKLIITERAELSLDDITDYYLTFHSVSRADKVLSSIKETLGSIVDKPFTYPVCFEIEVHDPSIRQAIVHHTFKIIFRVSDKTIDVLEILHGKRDPNLIKDL